MSRELMGEAAFNWWVPYVLKKRARIVSLVKGRIRKKTRKYGIAVPRSIKEALEFDRENPNTFWQDAIKRR